MIKTVIAPTLWLECSRSLSRIRDRQSCFYGEHTRGQKRLGENKSSMNDSREGPRTSRMEAHLRRGATASLRTDFPPSGTQAPLLAVEALSPFF